MNATPNFDVILLAAGVVLLLALFFGFFGWVVVDRLKRFARWQDGAAARQRAEIERERRDGPTPLWLKSVRVSLVIAAIALVGTRFWMSMAPA